MTNNPEPFEHRIEADPKVYLLLDENRQWMVDYITADGYPLDPAGEHAYHVARDCVDGCEDHRSVEEIAGGTLPDLPTAEQLFRLLGRALGKEGF